MAPRKIKKPDATRCGLCGAMCTDPKEVSRHHKPDCSRYPDNRPKPAKKMKPAEVAEAVPLFDKKTGMPWEHTHEVSGGSSHCMACIVEGNAPRAASPPYTEWLGDMIDKLGFLPRYPGLTNEQHIVELIGPRWAEDAKEKWILNWTVDGYLARRPNLKARARTHEMLRDDGDGVGAEHSPSPRWGVVVTKRGVVFNIDHQSFMLRDDYDPEDGWTKEAYYKWYAKQLTIAFKRLMGET